MSCRRGLLVGFRRFLEATRLSVSPTGFNRSGIDFDKSSEDIPTFVSVPDTGVLRRFTEPGTLSGECDTQVGANRCSFCSLGSDFKALMAGLSARSPSAGSNTNAAPAEGG